MSDRRDASGMALPDSERLTPLGICLRKSSLDELPQLWNVLRGEMSLVGLRPLYVPLDQKHTSRHAKRLEVRPGITGWAQVNGRQAIRLSECRGLDVRYVEHMSLWLDLSILARTVVQILRASDVRSGQTTELDDLGYVEFMAAYRRSVARDALKREVQPGSTLGGKT